MSTVRAFRSSALIEDLASTLWLDNVVSNNPYPARDQLKSDVTPTWLQQLSIENLRRVFTTAGPS
jgi:hypothetical protein